MSLKGLTVVISGASRGIGKALALRCAQNGANIVATGKTAKQHDKLQGTIHETAQEIRNIGKQCLPLQLDVRDESQVEKVIVETVDKFGSVDILINNASAIYLTGTEKTTMKQYDLMNNVNTRGTYLMSKYCSQHMKNSKNGHILNLSPPLNLHPSWFKNNVAYTISKYGMSMCALGMSEEFEKFNIKVNCLWPLTAIYTAAMERIGGGDSVKNFCRSTDIVCDAAMEIFTDKSDKNTGNFYVDEHLLKTKGYADFERYAFTKDAQLITDFFVGSALPTHDLKTDDGNKNIKFVEDFITRRINRNRVEEVGAVFYIDFGDSKYIMDLKNGNGSFIPCSAPDSPDCSLTISISDFEDIIKGKTNTMNAFVSGKLKIDGDMTAAIKLENLLKSHVE